jgi:hypothetical protein
MGDIITVFGNYSCSDEFITWYINNKDELKSMFNELIIISCNNGIDINYNEVNFNSFIVTTYTQSNYSI